MLKIEKTRLKQFTLGALAAALGAGTYVIAAVTFSDFQSGTTISASEMNAKLNALKDAANANAASVACPADTAARFTDNGDGTVCDSQTGLMWEIKTETVGTPVACVTPADCTDPHDVNNVYNWTLLAATNCPEVVPPYSLDCLDPDGTLYTNFLEMLNDLKTPNDGTATPCFAEHCDWRIPTIGELRSILEAPNPDCTASPCIAAGFPGPIQAAAHWSSSTRATDPIAAWEVNFNTGEVLSADKGLFGFARAVRGGR